MIDRADGTGSDTIRIHRYPNRRLYDTVAKRYVRMEDLVVRIERGERVLVLDAQSGDDVTASVLLPQVLEIFARTAASWLTPDAMHRVIAVRAEIIARGPAALIARLRGEGGETRVQESSAAAGGLEQRMNDLERMVGEIARAVSTRRE